MTSWRFAPRVRCDVDSSTCAVAAVASKVKAFYDRSVLITVSSSIVDLNPPSAIRADALLDLTVNPPVLPFHLPGSGRVVRRKLVLRRRPGVPFEGPFRRDRDLIPAWCGRGILVLSVTGRGRHQTEENGGQNDTVHCRSSC